VEKFSSYDNSISHFETPTDNPTFLFAALASPMMGSCQTSSEVMVPEAMGEVCNPFGHRVACVCANICSPWGGGGVTHFHTEAPDTIVNQGVSLRTAVNPSEPQYTSQSEPAW